MQYCSIEEAWKDPLIKETKKKKKQKKLYSSKIPKYIEDTSYLEGGHDYHCATHEEPNFSTKHKKRHDHSRTHRNTYRKNKTRTPNVQVSYDQAAQEYRGYQMENNQISKSQQNNDFLIEGFESGDDMNNIEELERSFNDINDVDDSEYTNGNVEDTYSPSTSYATETEAETEPETEVEEDEDTDSEINDEVEKIVEDTVKENNQLVNINDIDYRLNNLNRNVNMLIKKMNDSDFFDDESQDNIHDLVLFILFGVFMIFVLDTIYKLGRKN